MKPSPQVQKAVAKAIQTLDMIKRSFKYLSKDSFYSCTEPISDRISNTVYQLGHRT